MRGTLGIDIIIELKKKYFIGAEKALAAIGLKSQLPVDATRVFDFRKEYIRTKNLIAWRFYNPLKRSENLDIIITHDLAKTRTKQFRFGRHALRVIAKRDLIAMKKASSKKPGREQGLEDVKALEAGG